MKHLKKVTATTLSLAMALSLFACGGAPASEGSPASETALSSTSEADSAADPGAKTYDEHLVITVAVDTTNVDVNSDDFGKFWNDKFNFEWEVVDMNTENKAEMQRIWINSGDMPDLVNWDYVHSEAVSYVEQGLIRKLPDDWKTRWPNLAKAYADSGVGDLLDNLFGGTYILPKPIFSNNKPIDPLVFHGGLFMRKDWMEAVGAEIKDYYTVDELLDIARLLKEKDPGNVGDTFVPIQVPTSQLPTMFLQPNSTYVQNDYQYFPDENGTYQWGPAQPETLYGLQLWRKALDEGLLNPEFYNMVFGQDVESTFDVAGTAAINFNSGMATVFARYATYMKENLDLGPDALHYAFLVSDEGEYHSYEPVNFWGAVIFSPQMDDATFERLMDILDYSTTKEGQDLINMGFEGVDWELDAAGNPQSLLEDGQTVAQKYPSNRPLYTHMICLPDDFQLVNPTIPQQWRDLAMQQYLEKAELSNDDTIARVDYDIYFYDSPARTRATFNLADEFASIVLKGTDVEANWNAWVNEKMPLVQPVLDELTEMKKN